MSATARELHLQRRAARAKRQPKGVPGHQPHLRRGELEMRVMRSAARIVARKLKAGRPGRGSNAPSPAFDWERVINASQRKGWAQ